MDNLELILAGQEKMEKKLDQHLANYNEMKTQVAVDLKEGKMTMEQQSKLLASHAQILEDIQRLKYKAIGAAVLGGSIISIIAFIINIFT